VLFSARSAHPAALRLFVLNSSTFKWSIPDLQHFLLLMRYDMLWPWLWPLSLKVCSVSGLTCSISLPNLKIENRPMCYSWFSRLLAVVFHPFLHFFNNEPPPFLSQRCMYWTMVEYFFWLFLIVVHSSCLKLLKAICKMQISTYISSWRSIPQKEVEMVAEQTSVFFLRARLVNTATACIASTNSLTLSIKQE